MSKHEKILEMLRAGVGIRTTAKVVGVGVRTVQRRRAVVEDEFAEATKAEAGEVEFGSQRWRCPAHGWVEVRPCVMCASLAAMRGGPRGGTSSN